MLRVPQLCPFCEVRSLLTPLAKPVPRPVQWQQYRLASQMQKRRPSRMQLAGSVAAPRVTTDKAKRPKPHAEGPYAGLNKTRANIPPPDAKSTGRSSASRPRSADDQFKALKMQQALTPIPYGTRGKIRDKIREIESFAAMPLLPVIQESIPTQAFPDLEEIKPTPVQRVAIPALLGKDKEVKGKRFQQFLLAAETGSGKTLAYLLPVIDAMKRAEMKEAEMERQAAAEKERQETEKSWKNPFEVEPPPLSTTTDKRVARPRAIILVPTAELVAQVGALAKSFSHTVKFKAAPISSAYSSTVIKNRLFNPNGVDMVITTPHLIARIAESDPNILSRVSHIVVDEADSLFDRSFSPLTTEIIDKSAPSLQQLIMCSATIPQSLERKLRKLYPDLQRLVTPNLHAIPRRVQLGVVDVNKDPYRGNKDLACADTIWNIGRAHEEHAGSDGKVVAYVKRMIVFVNEREKSIELAEYLNSKGIDAIAINRDTAGERHSKLLATFKSNKPEAINPEEEKAPNFIPSHLEGKVRRHLPNTKVLVTTDLGSRGIDTLAVRHVILYDVPHTTIDFIHRLGRTGRMGRRGRGVVLVGRGDRTDIVAEVRETMFKGQALI